MRIMKLAALVCAFVFFAATSFAQTNAKAEMLDSDKYKNFELGTTYFIPVEQAKLKGKILQLGNKALEQTTKKRIINLKNFRVKKNTPEYTGRMVISFETVVDSEKSTAMLVIKVVIHDLESPLPAIQFKGVERKGVSSAEEYVEFQVKVKGNDFDIETIVPIKAK